MRIRMLSPIRNFSMEMEISLTKNLKIIKGELLNSKIQLSRKFKEQVGSMNWELLTSHYIRLIGKKLIKIKHIFDIECFYDRLVEQPVIEFFFDFTSMVNKFCFILLLVLYFSKTIDNCKKNITFGRRTN